MKILSIRKGFQADHSSTSYEFLAIDKPLSRSDREKVAGLSSRARPTRRRVSFIYHGDWNDLPGGWSPLMKKYYDVMYSESYGWWTLVMAFKTNKKIIEQINKYEFSGTDEMGVSVSSKENRVVISIHCHLYPGFDSDEDHDDYYEDEDEEETGIESDDSLLNLLTQNREYLKKGDCRLLYGVWQKYGLKPEEAKGSKEEIPPKPRGINKLPQPTKYLLSLLEDD